MIRADMRRLISVARRWQQKEMAMGNGLRALSWRLVALATVILLALGMLPGLAPTGSVSAQADELSQDEFDELVAAAQDADPIFGPEDGELEHDPDLVTLSFADVEVADFLATAVFGNPYGGTRNQFDYGIQFRISGDAGEVLYLRFIVLSTLDWAITDNDGEIVVQGVYEDLDIRARGENELTLYAQGDIVHVGINGDYVGSAEVGIMDPGAIAVGTSFFADSFQEDAVSEFFEFTVWEVAGPGTERDEDPFGPRDEDEPPAQDEDDTTPADEDEPTPTEEDEEPTPTEEDEEAAPTEEGDDEPAPTEAAEGATYESPTYGYTFEYDETWEVRTESSNEDIDIFEITNGTSSLQFLGHPSEETPTECIDGIIAGLEGNNSVASVEIALDESDQEMRGDGETAAFVVLTVSYAATGDLTVDFGAYYGCYQIEDGALLQVTHLTPLDSYNDEIENRAAVLDTLDVDGDGEPDITPTPEEAEPTPTEADVEPTATEADEEPTATEAASTPAADDVTPTEALPEGAVAIFLPSISAAGTSAIGSLVPAGNRTEVALLVILGDPETDYVVTINTGICINPGPVEHLVGVTDANGLVEATVDATVEELSSGDFIMVLARATAPDEPVACGNLADLAG